jgi:transcriptional regulator with XRE-family HTH domain
MDWETIHATVARRKRKLGLTNDEIARRGGMHPKTVTNLLRGQVSEASLCKASRALEWPDDALLRTGHGEATAGDLPRVPWVDHDALSMQRRVERLEAVTSNLVQGIDELRRELELQGWVTRRRGQDDREPRLPPEEPAPGDR